MIALLTRVPTEAIVLMESAITNVVAKLALQTKTVPQVSLGDSRIFFKLPWR